MLFEEPSSPGPGQFARTDPLVSWYSRSTRPEAKQSRVIVNGWYAVFPDEGGRLAARLRSRDNPTHVAALSELFIHNELKMHHGDVRYEEDGRGPDFRIYDGGSLVGAVEVVTLTEQQDFAAEQGRGDRLIDFVNETVRPTQGFMIGITVLGQGEVPQGKYSRWLTGVLGQLNWSLETGPIPPRTFVHQEVAVETNFYRVRDKDAVAQDPDALIVGVSSPVGGAVRLEDRLRGSVLDKAGSRYDLASGTAFTVAAVLRPTFVEDFGVISALYGSLSVGISQSTEELRRHGNGVFGITQDGAALSRRLSSVHVVTGLRPGLEGDAVVSEFMNPYASSEWPGGCLSAHRRFGVVEADEVNFRMEWIE